MLDQPFLSFVSKYHCPCYLCALFPFPYACIRSVQEEDTGESEEHTQCKFVPQYDVDELKREVQDLTSSLRQEVQLRQEVDQVVKKQKDDLKQLTRKNREARKRVGLVQL